MHVFPLRWLCGACCAALLLAVQAMATPPECSRHCPSGCPADCSRSCPAQCGDTCPAECTRGCPGYNCPCDPCEPCSSDDECNDETGCEDNGCCDKDRTKQECSEQECGEEDCCDEGGCEWTGGLNKLWPWSNTCGKGDECHDKPHEKPQTAGCPFGFFAGMFPPGCCESESCEAGKPCAPAKPTHTVEFKVEVKGCDCKCSCGKCGCSKGASSTPQAHVKGHVKGHAGKFVCYPAETAVPCCPTGPPVGYPCGGPGDHVMVWTPGPHHMVGPGPVGPPPPPPHDWMYHKLNALTAENAALKARMEAQHEYGQRIKELEQKLAEAQHTAATLKSEQGGSTKEGVLTELLKSQAESSAQKDELLVELLGGLMELQLAAPETSLEGRLDKLEELLKQVHEDNAALKSQVHELKKEAKRVAREKAEQANKPVRATRGEAVRYETPR